MRTKSCIYLAPYPIYRHGREGKHNLKDCVPVSSTSGRQITVHDILIDKQLRSKPLKVVGVAQVTCFDSFHS